MDVSGLVVTSLALCFETASALYNYGTRVKAARKEIQSLSNELFGLIGALEHLKHQRERLVLDENDSKYPPAYADIDKSVTKDDGGNTEKSTSSQERFETILKETVHFLNTLKDSLVEPKGRFNSAVHFAKWPLRESEVKRHIERLERVKTYFILTLVVDEVDQSRKVADEIAALRLLLQDVVMNQAGANLDNQRRVLVGWLSPVDPDVIRRSIEKTRMPRTGAWFLQSEAFRAFRKSQVSTCLWVNGITGAGKTTLMTATIEDLSKQQEPSLNPAYFYCTFSNDESLQTQNILGSVLAQICSPSDPVFKKAKDLHSKMSKNSLSTAGALDACILRDLIIEQAAFLRGLTIVIDGLNECSDEEELLTELGAIMKSAAGVRLLIFSINEKGISEKMTALPRPIFVTMSPKIVRNDISLLVESSLRSQSRLKALPIEVKKEIAERLTDGADGMFRWVQCQLDILARLRTPRAVQNALANLPHTLDQTYENLLSRIDTGEDAAITRSILELLTFASHPLSLQAVHHFLQTTPGMSELDKSKSLTRPEDILDICGSLLKYNEKTKTATLAHHSVKMYLTSNPRNQASYFRLEPQEAHGAIALRCLTYLNFDTYSKKTGVLDDDSSLDSEHAFLDYAVYNWALHLQQLETISPKLWEALRSFLLSGDKDRFNFGNYVQYLISDSDYASTTPPIYYAASYGLTVVVKYLLSLGVDIEVAGGRGGATPINIAAYRGHLDVVKVLYEAGANPLKVDGGRLSAVDWATYLKQWDIVDFFESKGLKSRSRNLAEGRRIR